ncbi:hypothetical protein CHS0354_026724 [Potamilus streckersoni]|uniref:MD-2-related lipid-recognition domain-containing protein n=1 Tax=Potamilus streckersoni TaxID=2493646 RepID=A0AAE0VG24_9BIVA|nr:hypothetical protein CHS0354_026724 [Potamilus streckersoni]
MKSLVLCLIVVIAVSGRNVIKFEMDKEVKNIKNGFDFLKTKAVDLFSLKSKQLHSQVNRPGVKLTSFQWKDCGGPSDIINIKSLDISPDPIVSPGSLFVSASGVIKKLIGSPLLGDLLMYKKTGGQWIKLPCILPPLGSCHFDNLCTLLNLINPCPDPIVQSGLGCKCPFQKGDVQLPKTVFDIPSASLPAGDFHVIGNLTFNGTPAGCLDLYLSFSY